MELARRTLLALGAVLAVALIVRIGVTTTWRATAGDGVQYLQLAQELREHHRLAFGPPPTPLQYSRVPGYPLFLAFVASPFSSARDTVMRAAAVWNVLFDVGTALLVFFLLADAGFGLGARWAALAAVLVCPILVFLSCYTLSESLATFLTTLELLLALRARRHRLYLYAALAGAVAAVAQLVRVDALVAIPAALVALAFAAVPWRKRALAVAAFVGAGLVVFAPWPLRNLYQFGALHPEGTHWMRQDGTPLRTGMMTWMCSYASGAAGEDYNIMVIALDRELDVHRPGIVQPAMYDDEAEHQRVIELFQRYNRERLSPAVDQAFLDLAHERLRRHPFRTLVALPLRRFVAEWSPMPEWELPVRSHLLGLPQHRVWYARFEWLLFALALVGAVVSWRRDRALCAVLLVAIAARSGLHAWVHPVPNERYMAECFPALLALSGVGAWFVVERLRRRQIRP